MNTISDVLLAQVTGGKGPDATTLTPSGSTSGSGNNDAVLSALNGIQSSLKDLGNNNSGGLFGGSNGLMFGMMAGLAMRNRSSEVVVHGSWGSRRGFSWRASW
jgi:hypothetical protein